MRLPVNIALAAAMVAAPVAAQSTPVPVRASLEHEDSATSHLGRDAGAMHYLILLGIIAVVGYLVYTQLLDSDTPVSP